MCFEFVCSDPMGSDRNHPVLHLLHLGQHSLRAVEDLILMCGRRDPYPRHVSVPTKHKTRGDENMFHFLSANSFAFNMKSKNSILPEHLNAKVEVFNASLASARDY